MTAGREPLGHSNLAERNVGVFVVGMHRGGTSAVTHIINLLGVPTGTEEAVKGPSIHNPTGFWEVRALTKLNERLLVELGGTWSAPPAPPDSWIDDERLEPLREYGRELFEWSHTTPQWVWKDPRHSILLPFWLDVLDVEPVVILVSRHPHEVAGSLAVRDRFSHPYGVALWERYMRTALAAIDGLPVLVARYGELLDAPEEWMASTRDFLAGNGIQTLSSAVDEEAAQFLDPALRHTDVSLGEIEAELGLSDPQAELLGAIDELAATSERFVAPSLPRETPSTEALIEERRYNEVERAAEKQRAAEARKTRRKGLARARRLVEEIDANVKTTEVKRQRRDLRRVREILAELATAEQDGHQGPPDRERE